MTIVTPRGWWDLADAAVFYPTDLPEDWRLSYFANAFRASLVPHSAWASADSATLAQWREDVTPSFRFIAETAQGLPRADRVLEQALGPQLSIWLSADPLADGCEPNGVLGTTRCYPCWPAHDQRAEHHGKGHAAIQGSRPYAVLAPQALHQDLRAARHWLEALRSHRGQPPAIIVLSQPRSQTLEAWTQLVALLG